MSRRHSADDPVYPTPTTTRYPITHIPPATAPTTRQDRSTDQRTPSSPVAEQFMAELLDIERRISESCLRPSQQPRSGPISGDAARAMPIGARVRSAPSPSFHGYTPSTSSNKPLSPSNPYQLMPSHQVKSVPIYTGRGFKPLHRRLGEGRQIPHRQHSDGT